MSLCRQNYTQSVETAINTQINLELHASHTYLSAYSYFTQSNIALPGLAKYFFKASKEEREHAERFINYQNLRGGKVILSSIKEPIEFNTRALEVALQLEKDVNSSLLSLSRLAEENNDPQLGDFIDEFLKEQVESMKELADFVTQLKRVDYDGLGLFLFDRDLLKRLESEE